MVTVTAAASANLSGVRNCEETSVAIMLMPGGNTAISGPAMSAYTSLANGTSTKNASATAITEYNSRSRSSMRCDIRLPAPSTGASAAESSGLFASAMGAAGGFLRLCPTPTFWRGGGLDRRRDGVRRRGGGTGRRYLQVLHQPAGAVFQHAPGFVQFLLELT